MEPPLSDKKSTLSTKKSSFPQQICEKNQNQEVGKSLHLKGQLEPPARDKKLSLQVSWNSPWMTDGRWRMTDDRWQTMGDGWRMMDHGRRTAEDRRQSTDDRCRMTDDKAGQVQSELSAGGTKRDVENTPKSPRPNCILAWRSSLGPPPVGRHRT